MMKRKSHRLILLCALFMSLFISLSIAAEVTFLKGKAQVKTSGDAEWMPAEVGMQIDIGDSIQTARRSKIDLALDKEKKNVIRIDQNTLVVINSTVAGEINRFDVSQGTIYASIENAKSGLIYEIASPSSVAGVRGTGWKNDVQRDRDEISCFEREIFVKTYDKLKNLISETIVPEGFKTIVERFAAASSLIELSSRERSDWNRTRSDVSNRIEKQQEARGTQQREAPAQNVQEVVNQVETIQKATVENMSEVKEIQEDITTQKTLDEVIRESGHGH